MKILKYLCLVVALISLAACGKAGENVAAESPGPLSIVTQKPYETEAPTTTVEPNALVSEEPTPEPTEEPEPEHEEYIGDPDISLTPFDSEGRSIDLTDEEKGIFDKYLSTLDINIFKDVPPVSIAKIFIQCGIEGKGEAEYTMFYKSDDIVSKEIYLAENERDLATADIATRKSMADSVFADLYLGTFTENPDGTGILHFKMNKGGDMEFRFIKNEDGVWMVKYAPFDE